MPTVHLLTALLLAATSGQFSAQPPQPQKHAQGRALMCDTPQQLGRFLDLLNQGRTALDAVRTVNEEAHDRSACQNVVAIFDVSRLLVTIKLGGRDVGIVEVTVTAVDDGSGWSPVQPRTQYMMQADPEETL